MSRRGVSFLFVVCSSANVATPYKAESIVLPESGRGQRDSAREEPGTTGTSGLRDTTEAPESSFADAEDLTGMSAWSRLQSAMHTYEGQLQGQLAAAQSARAAAARQLGTLKSEAAELVHLMQRHGVRHEGAQKAEAKSAEQSGQKTQAHAMTAAQKKMMDSVSTPDVDGYVTSLSASKEKELREREEQVTWQMRIAQDQYATAQRNVALLEGQVNNLFGLLEDAESGSSDSDALADPLMVALQRLEQERKDSGRKPATRTIDLTTATESEATAAGASFINSTNTSLDQTFDFAVMDKKQMLMEGMRQQELFALADGLPPPVEHQDSLLDTSSKSDAASTFATALAMKEQSLANTSHLASLHQLEKKLTGELKIAEVDRTKAAEQLIELKGEASNWLGLLELDTSQNTASVAATTTGLNQANQMEARKADIAAEKVQKRDMEGAGAVAGDGSGGKMDMVSKMKIKQSQAMELMRQSVNLAQSKEDAERDLHENLEVLDVELHSERSGRDLDDQARMEDSQAKMERHWQRSHGTLPPEWEKPSGTAPPSDNDEPNPWEHSRSSAIQQSATNGARSRGGSSGRGVPASDTPEHENCQQLREHAQSDDSHLPLPGHTQETHTALLVRCALAVSRNMRYAHSQYVQAAERIANLETQVGDLFTMV